MDCKFHFPMFHRNEVVVYPFKRDRWTPPVVVTPKKKLQETDAGAAATDTATGSQPKKARVEDPAEGEGEQIF